MYKNDDFFKVIGHITIFFATLDFMITYIIFNILDTDKIKEIKIDDRTTLSQKFRIIQNLQQDNVNSSILNEIKKLLPEAFEISKERNRYIHDQWVFNPEKISEGKITRYKIKMALDKSKIKLGPFLGPKVDLNISDLYKFLKNIGDLQMKIGQLKKDYLDNN